MLKKMIEYIHKNFVVLSVFIICVYALYLRIVHLYGHELWIDEIFYLNPLRGGLLQFLKAIPETEFCSYLSGDLYIFYPFFKVFSYNKWGLAIPSIIATITGFYILYLICKRYFKSKWSYLITFSIVCFNATLINHATEIRTYAFLPTLALAAFYTLQRIADSGFKLSILKKVRFVIFFVLVIWFHVYGILMFFSFLCFTLFSEDKEKDSRINFKNVFSLVGIILCFAMPLWLFSVFGPHVNYAQLNINTFDYIPNPINNVVGFLKGVFGNLMGYKKLYFLLLGAVIPFVFSYKDRRRQLLFLSFAVIIPICLIFVSDVAQKYWFIQRQFIWVMPLFAFFLGWAWDSFFMLLKSKALKRAK